jgi:steroid 5-alpha reductase family enzyme
MHPLQQGLALTQWDMLLILFGLALLISAVGFYRVVYFISVGYAFSVVAMALAVLVLLYPNATWASALQNVLLIVWGLRLGIYLVRREFKSSYASEAARVHQGSAAMLMARRALIWVGVSLLYVAMFSPSLFVSITPQGAAASWAIIPQAIGLALMAGGLLLEAAADRQKSNFKAVQPKRFCDAGLYRVVRCPNYLGEITFWVGNWIAAIGFYNTPFRWVVALIGAVCIVLIMIGSAKRLEESQGARYGAMPDYQEYVRTVPVLFPFVPLYSLKNARIYLG